MFYNGVHHYGAVKGGKIIDDGKDYSPSEWASKIAGGTSRNAWRDLWFREPLSNTWVPAQLLRNQAQKYFAAQELACRCAGGCAMMTRHAVIRAAQRGIRQSDIELIVRYGTPTSPRWTARTSSSSFTQRSARGAPK